MSDIEVVHVPERDRYVIRVDGEDAGLTVAKESDDGTVLFSHTKVSDEYEGQGLASKLVAGALDDVRANGKKIEVTCDYVKNFLDKHGEYQDLAA